MTTKEFETRLANIRAQEQKFDVKINISDIIDKDHLDCTWYGGEVGTIKMSDGWIITIGAYGDIRLGGIVNGTEVDIKDKRNGGSVYNELGHILNDDKLYQLIDSEDAKNFLCYENNNWFEIDLISPNGEFVDLYEADNVLDDNLLDCFEDIESYFNYIKWAKEEI